MAGKKELKIICKYKVLNFSFLALYQYFQI